MYILFEGIDTSGKSTQIERLKQIYPDMIATYEPGNTQLGREIRSILLERELDLSPNAEALLFLADRAEHYAKVVEPKRDKLIVSDRGFISGIAYALANDKEANLEFLIELNRFVLNAHLPDKIVFFEMSEQLLSERISAKSHDKIEKRGLKYLLDVQQNMRLVIERANIAHIVLDASESIEDLHTKIRGFIDD